MSGACVRYIKDLCIKLFMKRYLLMKSKIKEIKNYLGPRVGYSSDEWLSDKVDRWLMEYLLIIKDRYYKSLKKKKLDLVKNRIGDIFKNEDQFTYPIGWKYKTNENIIDRISFMRNYII